MSTSKKVLALAMALIMTMTCFVISFADDDAREDFTDSLIFMTGTYGGYDYSFCDSMGTSSKIKSTVTYGHTADLTLYNRFSFGWYDTLGNWINYNGGAEYSTTLTRYDVSSVTKDYTVNQATAHNNLSGLPTTTLFKYCNYGFKVNGTLVRTDLVIYISA